MTNISTYRFSLLGMVLSGVVVICSCSRESVPAQASSPVVSFAVDVPEDLMDVETKTTQVTSLASTGFNVVAVTGEPGSESLSWGPTAFTGSTVFTGGRYWPMSGDPGWVFYASNASMTFAAGGTTVSASNATDVVVARKADATVRTRNTLVFTHVFSRIGNVIVSEDFGYTVSDISIKITPKTGGTYNLRTGAWSSLSAGSATEIAPEDPGMAMNDLYLVPGTYTLSASWHVEKGVYSEDFVNVEADVTLIAGHLHMMDIVLGGNASSIIINLTLSPWGELSLDFESGEYMTNINVIAA